MLFHLKTIGEYVSFLTAKKITPNQALFCHLIYSQDMANFYRYVHEFKAFSVEEVEDLEDRGYIINFGHHAKTKYSDMYAVTDSLLDGLDLVDNSLGEAFWNLYPNFILVNSQQVPAKSCDRDQLILDYTRKAVSNVDQHNEIITLLTYAKSRQLITMGIRKWIDSRQWEVVREVMNNESNQTPHGDTEF